MRAPSVRPALAFALAAAAATHLLAQNPPVKDSRTFESGIEITSVTTTVTDREGHPLTGLPRDVFEVYEDGVRQTITQFTNERVPIGQPMEFYRALKDRGKTTELVFYPREGHGFTEYYHQVDRMKREYEWISRYTLGASLLP